MEDGKPQRSRVPYDVKRRRHPWLKFAAIAASSLFSLVAVLLLAIAAFRLVGPPITPVMIADRLRDKTVGPKRWVRLEDMARELPLAVIASEDSKFCDHWGVDWGQVWTAIERGQESRRRFRGASTIPMQTVKNLYLWNERSYVRKALEVPLVHLMTMLWPKKIVLETYLNIAPWGTTSKGPIVGAEAASQHYFGKSAGALTSQEAARLAVALPCPNSKRCNPRKPSSWRLSRARQIFLTCAQVVSCLEAKSKKSLINLI